MPVDLQGVLKIIHKLSELERTLAAFYEICGDRWKEEYEFWTGLAEAESRHAAHLDGMAGLISDRPGYFESGRPFNVMAIDTAISGIKMNTEKIRGGDFQKLQTLHICRDIESSILESRFVEVVKTEDLAFNAMVSRIVSETSEHRTLISQKIESMRLSTAAAARKNS